MTDRTPGIWVSLDTKPEARVPISDNVAAILRSAGAINLTVRIWKAFSKHEFQLRAPYWALRAAEYALTGRRRSHIIKLIGRAAHDPNIRDALIVVMQSGDRDLVQQLAVAQAMEEPK